jgi:O-antigen ligase
MIGTSSLLSVSGASRVCGAVAVIGVVLAITGIVQKAVGAGKPLGFWTPVEGGSAYGPFVNRNHFAGWMLMAIPVCIGLLCGMVSRRTRGAEHSIRERLLWLASPEASQVVLLAAGIAVMTLSVFLTQSRSGVMAAIVAVVLTVILAWRRSSGSSRLAIVGALLVILVGVAAWAGVDQTIRRFGDATQDAAGRLGPWQDAWSVAKRYPLTGTGLNTYSVAMLFYQRFNPEVFYSAAHNDYLQVIAEGGVLVSVPVAAAVLALVVTIRRRFKQEISQSTYWIRAGATIGLAAIALQEAGDFSLQIPGNAFLFAVTCAIAIHRTPERRRA